MVVWAILIYTWANLKYDNKEKIDKCYQERKNFKEENKHLKVSIKKLEEELKYEKKELEKAKREIMEKNKFLAEDKIIIERLYEVKKLSDKINNILIDYDKETIQHLLNEYKKWDKEEDDEKQNNSWNQNKYW